MIRIILFTFFMTLAMASKAQELYQMGRSIRGLGMGGVVVPIVSGTDALFFNPAALAKNSSIDFNLANIGAGLNGADALSLFNAGTSLTSPSSYNQFFGKQIWFEAEGRTGFTFPNFGFGYMTEYSATLALHNPGFPQFQTYFVNDNVTAIGGAVTIAPKSYLGLNLKKVDRWGGSTTDLSLSTIANSSSLSSIGNNFTNKGTGYGVDIALVKELEAPTSPSVSLVWRDVGYTTFTQTAGTAAPPPISPNLIFGVGGGFDTLLLGWNYGLEADHLLDYDAQLGKKLHVGTELQFAMMDFRAGLGQGYLSYGLGLNLLIFRLDLATYTEELGVYPGQSGQNRWLAGLNIDLSFDANFNFTDNNGRKRKLKQRR